ncbi:hypothetical protein MCOR02_007847 [Pyricularia oryzae]|nr:hypothetical protein MCOR02_007847 [Pyricularia oryzae]
MAASYISPTRTISPMLLPQDTIGSLAEHCNFGHQSIHHRHLDPGRHPLASAHYTFGGLVHNGASVGRDWQYVREHTRTYMPTFKDEAATSNDFRCNKGAGSGAKTDVFTVKRGRQPRAQAGL